MTNVTITEAIGETVTGCYFVSEETLIWVKIECLESNFFYDQAPNVMNLLTYFS